MRNLLSYYEMCTRSEAIAGQLLQELLLALCLRESFLGKMIICVLKSATTRTAADWQRNLEEMKINRLQIISV